ncbi:hypothetical protein M1O56_05455, partial [Dehalococcoidia bacterium]|nr:hypothetical protein [Dehalococcoidia bacterium]
MFNKKMIGLLIGILLLGSMLPGCPAPQAEVAVEVPQELKISLGMSIGGLDPHGSLAGDARIIWANIYETLVYLDENMQVQPRL